MAPFALNGSLIYAPAVIKDLGDFSMIRSPARCAARIGQAFSQTFSSIQIPSEALMKMPDIERNGRTFSDGVGTCSTEVLEKIWREYSQARGLKPTIFQIRFMGKRDHQYPIFLRILTYITFSQERRASSLMILDSRAPLSA